MTGDLCVTCLRLKRIIGKFDNKLTNAEAREKCVFTSVADYEHTPRIVRCEGYHSLERSMTITEAIKQIEKITGIADSTTGAGEAWRVIVDKLSENHGEGV